MIRVGDNYECVIERVDRHVGGKRVKDIVPDSRKMPLALVFEDSHTLPLLCPHCGRSLHVAPENEERVLDELAGLYLVGLAYVRPEQDQEGLALVFARDPKADLEDSETPTEEIVVHLESARTLSCPDESRPNRKRNGATRPSKRGSRKRR